MGSLVRKMAASVGITTITTTLLSTPPLIHSNQVAVVQVAKVEALVSVSS